MARDHSARKVKGPGGRQMELDSAPRAGGTQASKALRTVEQKPYEERVVTWMLAREEVHRKRK